MSQFFVGQASDGRLEWSETRHRGLRAQIGAIWRSCTERNCRHTYKLLLHHLFSQFFAVVARRESPLRVETMDALAE
jgi:hypothetical protein